MSEKKKFFTSHAKSSAAVVSLAIHALFAVVALSFVAVTVIKKDDQSFESKSVLRPKMQLKKLQVPVNIQKKQQRRPKMRQRIVVKTKVNRNMPDIKMPEISGIKGGLGNAGGASLGGAGSLGFSMPEINIFGIKSRGEKVFLILDSGNDMMKDEMGGIPAYTLIKSELVRIVEKLGPTTIFNVCVFANGHTYVLFPAMVPASHINTGKVKTWLDPLNAVKPGMGVKDYGPDTLGPGGNRKDENIFAGTFAVMANQESIGSWYRASMLSMTEKADTIFLLTSRPWGGMGYTKLDAKGVMSREEWDKTPAGKKWEKWYQEGLKKLDEDNAERAARGDPPKVITRADWAIVPEYFPVTEWPPQKAWASYSPKDFYEAFLEVRANSKSGMQGVPSKSGLSRKKSKKATDGFSFNVVRFTEKGEESDEQATAGYKDLTKRCDGKYKTIDGLEAIQGYSKSSE